jgi:hypothetical protein
MCLLCELFLGTSGNIFYLNSTVVAGLKFEPMLSSGAFSYFLQVTITL